MQNAELGAEPEKAPGVPGRTRGALLRQHLCLLPNEHFAPLPDEPDLAVGGLGYPLTAVQWMGGAL